MGNAQYAYWVFYSRDDGEIYCVNALSRAYPISTICLEKLNLNLVTCVNALSRAYPISTKDRKSVKTGAKLV